LIKKAHIILIFLVLYSSALGIRVYWLSQKNGLHVDEGMTIAYSFYNDYITAKNYDMNRKYTGKEIKEKSLVSESGFKDALSDIKNMRINNRDSPHTNLYYTFFRLAALGLKTTDIKPVIFRGGILNLIFFTISFVFFFLLMRILFPDSVSVQFFAVFCAFLSTASISNTLFLRLYQMQETMFIVISYFFFKWIDLRKFSLNDNKMLILGKFLFMSLLAAITLLTGYYAVIFIGLYGLYIIFINCREKLYAKNIFYFFIFALGILFAHVLYPNYSKGFSSYRGVETGRTVLSNAAENLTVSITAAENQIISHFYTLPVIIVCAVCLIYLLIKKQKLYFNHQLTAVFLIAVIYYITTLILAPYKILRYGMPVFPFFIVLPAVIINSVRVKSRTASFAAMLLIAAGFFAFAVNGNRIEHLYKNKPDEYVFSQSADIPVFVLAHKYSYWKYANLVPYLNDRQTYYFIESYDDIFSKPYTEFFLVTEDIPVFSDLKNSGFDILETFYITGGEPETQDIMGNYFICQRIRLKIL